MQSFFYLFFVDFIFFVGFILMLGITVLYAPLNEVYVSSA